jgi:alpha/beta superfamily hydrolase
MRTRFEERAVTISMGSAGPGDLEGLFVRTAEPGPGAVIAPPHPLYGGSMDSPVVNELAHACARSGLGCLRFNWRGVGASAGVPSGDLDAARADYAAALAHLAETVPGELVLCGYSFGAASAVGVAEVGSRAGALVLVSPPPALLDVDVLARFPGRVLVAVGEVDEYAPVAELKEICNELSGGRLHVIAETDHFFMTGLAELGLVVQEWLGDR